MPILFVGSGSICCVGRFKVDQQQFQDRRRKVQAGGSNPSLSPARATMFFENRREKLMGQNIWFAFNLQFPQSPGPGANNRVTISPQRFVPVFARIPMAFVFPCSKFSNKNHCNLSKVLVFSKTLFSRLHTHGSPFFYVSLQNMIFKQNCRNSMYFIPTISIYRHFIFLRNEPMEIVFLTTYIRKTFGNIKITK